MGTFLLLAALLHPNASPQPREIGALYFDVLNQSQVWVDLDPSALEKGPPPVRLNVTIAFNGRKMVGAPKKATLRASSGPWAWPLRVRLGLLSFHLADDTVIDLTAPGRVYQFTASCEHCQADTLATDVPFSDLETIAASPVVAVNALGFDLRLSPEDMAAIRRLIAAVRDGASVAEH